MSEGFLPVDSIIIALLLRFLPRVNPFPAYLVYHANVSGEPPQLVMGITGWIRE